jgi:AcrR family transcriptional regulator
MNDDDARTVRKPRADGQRNRARLLASARAVFSTAGTEASLEALARHAGVGIATLYRHFPTRESLFEAVYRHEVEQLAACAEELTLRADMKPIECLRRWLHASVAFVATKKGMLSSLALAAPSSPDLAATSFEALTRALRLLLRRAADAGEIRGDIGPEELLRTVFGICYMHDRPDWQDGVLRLIDVFVDGLRIPAARGG